MRARYEALVTDWKYFLNFKSFFFKEVIETICWFKRRFQIESPDQWNSPRLLRDFEIEFDYEI